MTIENKLLAVVCGPTASGKTATAIRLASSLSTEIISADSRQFYRQMKIGTAFPSEEELLVIPHHFTGHLDITEDYNVSRFETDALKLLDELFLEHSIVIMAGGSGLYINAVCRGIDLLPDPDPELRQELKIKLAEEGLAWLQQKLREYDPHYYSIVDLQNPARLIRAVEVSMISGIPYSDLLNRKPADRHFRILKSGLYVPKEELNVRIGKRVDSMIASGLIEESRELYPLRHLNAMNTVGYKELFVYFDGKCTLKEAIDKIKTNSRRYAKRQMTWFRKDHEIRWFRPEEATKMLEYKKKGN